MFIRKTFYTLLTFVFLFSSCNKEKEKEVSSPGWGKGSSSPTKNENLANRELWGKSKPDHYRYKLRVTCRCRFDTHDLAGQQPSISRLGWVIIEIKNDAIVSVMNIDNNQTQGYTERVDHKNPIEKFFDLIGNQSEHGYEKIFVIYDSDRGFPRYYENTGETGPTDIAIRFEIVEFEVL